MIQILEGGTRSGATDSAATLQSDSPSTGTQANPLIEAHTTVAAEASAEAAMPAQNGVMPASSASATPESTLAFAAVPSNEVCMNCHKQVRQDSTKLLPLREAWASNKPLPWVQIHNLPDYAYFDHSIHVNAAIGCESCHGRIDQMVEVWQDQPLSMGWCLDCHKAPENHLRPKGTSTVMGYTPPGGDQLALGEKIKKEARINPPINCSGCHR